MSGRKTNLKRYRNISGGDMSTIITSDVTDIQFLDNIGFQYHWTGTPTGTFTVEVSANHIQDAQGVVTVTGNWVALPLTPVPTATGAAGNLYIDINQISAPYIRTVYTPTGAAVQTIAPVPDVAKSLASTYFLLSDEATTNKYAIWFKVSGTGSAPSVSGYTNVEQDISTGDTAATIGAALATTIAALNSTNSFTASGTTTVTVTNKTGGPFTAMTDGTTATGFTFAVTAGSGSVNANITAKML